MNNSKSLWLILASFFFSLMTVTTKAAGASYQFYDLMLSKYVLVSVLLFILLRIKKISLIPQNPLPLGGRCACGVLTAAANIYLITCLPASVAQCFNYTASFWIVLFLFIFLLSQNKRVPFFALLPVISGFAGMLYMVSPQKTNIPFYVLFIAIGYGLFSGAASLFLKRLGTLEEPTLRVAFYFSLACSIFSGILRACNGGVGLTTLLTDPLIWLTVIFALLYQVTKTYAWQFGNPFINSVFLFLGMPFVVVLSKAILSENLLPHQWIGMTIILVSASFCYYIRKNLKS